MPTATQLRNSVASLARSASVDLAPVFRGAGTPAAVEAALRDVLPGLVGAYGSAAASVAADWYDDLRDERGVRGRFTAVAAEIPDTGTQSLVGWALSESAEITAFRTLIEGGTQRRIANFARQTITGSSVADPRARGWQRTGVGDCDFCAMLIGRGAVYTEASADFQSHDHCNCAAEPAWG